MQHGVMQCACRRVVWSWTAPRTQTYQLQCTRTQSRLSSIPSTRHIATLPAVCRYGKRCTHTHTFPIWTRHDMTRHHTPLHPPAISNARLCRPRISGDGAWCVYGRVDHPSVRATVCTPIVPNGGRDAVAIRVGARHGLGHGVARRERGCCVSASCAPACSRSLPNVVGGMHTIMLWSWPWGVMSCWCWWSCRRLWWRWQMCCGHA